MEIGKYFGYGARFQEMKNIPSPVMGVLKQVFVWMQQVKRWEALPEAANIKSRNNSSSKEISPYKRQSQELQNTHQSGTIYWS